LSEVVDMQREEMREDAVESKGGECGVVRGVARGQGVGK